MHNPNPTAALLIIGNEILSGRTKDANLAWLGEQLAAMGIGLREVRVVPDVPAEIIDGVNALRQRFDVVFTTGGIGPTHDDITTENVAKAFGVPVIRHPDAETALRAHYKPEDINEARLKMANVPEGASLVANPVSAAPGYKIGNVYVFAGVPRIMQAMFENIRHELKTGEPILSRAVWTYLTEGTVAEGLTAIQHASPAVDIGSYPMIRDGKLGCSLVGRATDAKKLEEAVTLIKTLISQLGGTVIAEE